jgi:hypothetical protein
MVSGCRVWFSNALTGRKTKLMTNVKDSLETAKDNMAWFLEEHLEEVFEEIEDNFLTLGLDGLREEHEILLADYSTNWLKADFYLLAIEALTVKES